MKRRLIALVLVAVVAALVNSANAQQACAARSEIVANFATQFGESRASIGLDSKGYVIELLRARDGATWTIIATMPDGNACVVASGESWMSARPKIKANASSRCAEGELGGVQPCT